MRSLHALIKQALAQFFSCEVCSPTLAVTLLDQVLVGAKISAADRVRLDGRLRCPHCESELTLLHKVVPFEQEEVRNLNRLLRAPIHAKSLKKLESSLALSPRLGNLLPIARSLRTAVRGTRPVELVEKTWFKFVPQRHFDQSRFWQNLTETCGRYHRAGQYCFYLADSPKAAALEKIKEEKHQFGHQGWIAEVFPCCVIKPLDLRIPFLFEDCNDPLLMHFLRYMGLLRTPSPIAELDPAVYALTQFVSDVARRTGLDGLLYSSSQAYPFRDDAFGDCLVLFRPDIKTFLSLRDVKSYTWEQVVIDPPFDLPDREAVLRANTLGNIEQPRMQRQNFQWKG